jgi:hypothetical protein
MKAPTVKILEKAADRYVTTKNGQKQVWSQKAQLETEKMRVLIDVDIDGPTAAYEVGQVYEWDVTEDLVPGRFGPELARRMTLVAPAKPQQKAA